MWPGLKVNFVGQYSIKISEKRKAQVFSFDHTALHVAHFAATSGTEARLRSTIGQNRLNHLSLICPLKAIFCASWILPASLRSSLSEKLLKNKNMYLWFCSCAIIAVIMSWYCVYFICRALFIWVLRIRCAQSMCVCGPCNIHTISGFYTWH